MLQGDTYFQLQDPGAVGYGYKWYKTDNGNTYRRNTSNTAWVISQRGAAYNSGIYSEGINNYMTGALKGIHGIAPRVSPNFNSPTVGGENILTVDDLDEAFNSVKDTLRDEVLSGVKEQSFGQASDNVAFSSGIIGHDPTAVISSILNCTIPLPKFADGTDATEANSIWFYYPLCHYIDDPEFYEGPGSTHGYLNIIVTLPTQISASRTFTAYTHKRFSDGEAVTWGVNTFGALFAYISIGTR